jgi:acetyl esterase/lipase
MKWRLAAAAFFAAAAVLLHGCGGDSSSSSLDSENSNHATAPAESHALGAPAHVNDVPIVPPNGSAVTLSAADLAGFLNSYRSSADQRKQLLGAEVEKKLAQHGVTLTDSGFQISAGTETVTASLLPCDALKGPVPIAPPGTPGAAGPLAGSARANLSVSVDGNRSGVVFSADAGGVSAMSAFAGQASVDVNASLNWYQGYWQPGISCRWYGCFPTSEWKCAHLFDQPVPLSGSVDFTASLGIKLDAAIERDAAGRYYVVLGRNAAAASGGPVTSSVAISNFSMTPPLVPDGALWSVLRSAANRQIDSKVNEKLSDRVAALNTRVRPLLPIVFALPDVTPLLTELLSRSPTPDESQRVYDFIAAALNVPAKPFAKFIQDNLQNIVFHMLVGDYDGLRRMMASSAACSAANTAKAPIKPLNLFSRSSGGCTRAAPESVAAGTYYSDAGCSRAMDYRPTSMAQWCAEALQPTPNPLLGNAASWQADAAQPNNTPLTTASQGWTVAHGAQFDLGTGDVATNTAPFMRRAVYRDVPGTGGGRCQLEMRIYKKDPNATGLVPLLALHGGSWTYRGAAFAGLESELSDYTEAGFVVFVPFYRLVGDDDGNTECRNARWTDTTSDVEAAFDWVQDNAAALGAGYGKTAVMGQSAGAHLAEWLITHRPRQITRGLLLYPPVDVRDFLANARPGGAYASYQNSLPILSKFAGMDVSQIDLSSPPDFVAQNSFADLTRAAGGNLPPVFVLHGKRDVLIPSNQSVLLCNAYGGQAVDSGGGDALRAVYTCGPSGHLHLFEYGNHALDACLTPLLRRACLAADSVASLEVRRAAVALVADSLRQGRTWLRDTSGAPPVRLTGRMTPAAPVQTYCPSLRVGTLQMTATAFGGVAPYSYRVDMLSISDWSYDFQIYPSGASNVFGVDVHSNFGDEGSPPPMPNPLVGTFRLTVGDAAGTTSTQDFQASWVVDSSLCPPPDPGGGD